jgi:hypothetical protein
MCYINNLGKREEEGKERIETGLSALLFVQFFFSSPVTKKKKSVGGAKSGASFKAFEKRNKVRAVPSYILTFPILWYYTWKGNMTGGGKRSTPRVKRYMFYLYGYK